jgi:hypothetical protein
MTDDFQQLAGINRFPRTDSRADLQGLLFRFIKECGSLHISTSLCQRLVLIPKTLKV